MNALLRWETSMTDMPLDFQLVISDWACSRTSSGSVAGPAAKLNTRIDLTSRSDLIARPLKTPGRYCPGARTISGGWRIGSALVTTAERLGSRSGRAGLVAE